MNRKLPRLPERPIPFEQLSHPAFCRLVEFRAPKKDEYYLSGAKVAAYIAKNDMDMRYWIVKPLPLSMGRHLVAWEVHECPKCLSTDIFEMAAVKWFEDIQEYRIVNVDAPCHCNSCKKVSEKKQIRRIDATKQ